MKTKTISLGIVLLGGVTLLGAFIQNAPWVAPDKYVKMENPVKADAKSIKAGKNIFVTNCEECHGKKGMGDGTKAADIKTTVADLSSEKVQMQSDGVLFYKISEGRKDMPSAKKDLTDDVDRWNLVNYVRTLRKDKSKIISLTK